ncbi:MAG: polysaccharide biosynthesis protein [Lachnospiraceae bacterium]|jgi:nucleoside-diphosphate-sugar epimerase|nr:polysaccharide biosynthesis protein [Lachnospiraceae bacterium]MEE3460927.1 polysaccharide biosynthesis protein [Lachnospiraceae bacterium]
MKAFFIDKFISEFVTKRPVSMFLPDIREHESDLRKAIEGKKVLVIGGAGSIGSSFIRAILPFRPAALIVVDINENALAELTRDLRSTKGMFVPEDYIPYPMSYSSVTFKQMFTDRGGFDIVANFSAHKHVRSEKDIYSVEAMLKNNVLDARRLLDLLTQYPPQMYFCVSTDKAANPVNIMGASKRLMEDIIFSYSDKFPVKTARFANVAFSNGSLPAGFLARLSRLQPLSGPNDVKRYFVSPEESGQICMLSCMLADNREIVFPKLEKQQMMTFDKIGVELLHEYGYEPDYCNSDQEAVEKAAALKEMIMKGGHDAILKYPVHFTVSDTAGEKPFEEFYTRYENVDMSKFKELGVITGKQIPDREALGQLCADLDKIFDDHSAAKEKVIEIIGKYLPEFSHIDNGNKQLDSKM